MTRRFIASEPDFETRFDAFLAEPRGTGEDVAGAARAIVEDVRARGFEAVAQHTARLDDWTPDARTVRIGPERLEAAWADCAPTDRADLELAAGRIRAYHARQTPKDHFYTDEAGIGLGWRWSPVDAVGVYVPGGRASYPSSVLMNALPARLAGVERVVMVTPTPRGGFNPLVLAAARLAEIDEVFAIGGAQAIAALTFGAGPIEPVDKIVGPGNAYVAAAKRLVFGQVGIDTIAGPSEILVIADTANDPVWIAADLLSQSEHDPSSQSILVTDNLAFADAVAVAADALLDELETHAVARAAWTDHGAIVIVDDLVRHSVLIADHVAAEHVEIAAHEAEAIAGAIRHAGAIFVGRHAPEALGDYITGSNHVLPTSRAARFASGLSVLDFLKRTSIQRIDRAGLAAIGPAAARLARAEGLPAHARSVELRLEDDGF